MLLQKHLHLAVTLLGVALASPAHSKTPSADSQVRQAPAMNTQSGPGYLVVTGWYKDSSVQQAYIKKVGPLIRQHGFVTAKVGMPGVNLKVIEGDWTPRPFSLMQFSSQNAVKQFWTSDEYQNEVKPIRQGYSAVDVVKVGAAFGKVPEMTKDTALLVFFVNLTDRQTFIQQYAPKAPGVVARHGGKFLVSAGQANTELLEGDYHSKSMVVLEFPSTAALRGFWNDKEYKALSELRKAVGKWSVIEITPFPPSSPESEGQ